MNTGKEHMRVSVDGYTRVCLTLITALLTVLILGLWTEGVSAPDRAQAAEPFLNTSAQREDLVRAQDKTTLKIAELIKLLESGKVKVVTVDEATPNGRGKDVPSKKAK